ncbi:MAG: hypothetical protein IJV88_00185 [Ruminococcus sp.]|nr:hypothetical protein [Ruminococcus sp.]
MDLIDAYAMGLEGIENAFEEAGVGRLVGDMDLDRELTVKDATNIQKCIAGLMEFSADDFILAFEGAEDAPLQYISDFNRDCERNVKDATAIQKFIAGLEF